MSGVGRPGEPGLACSVVRNVRGLVVWQTLLLQEGELWACVLLPTCTRPGFLLWFTDEEGEA